MNAAKKGRICGIGVGIGDPEDLTLKAIRYIRESDVIICPQRDLSKCRAYQIVRKAVPEIDDKETVALEFEMTTDMSVRDANHKKIYETAKRFVEEGKNVTFLTIGDPAIYSTYSYIAKFAERDGIKTCAVSGISSVTACANALGITLCAGDEQLHIIPDESGLEDSLDLPGTKVIMKCGRNITGIRNILKQRSQDISVYAVSDCGTEKERCYRSLEELPDDGNYMMTIIVMPKKETD